MPVTFPNLIAYPTNPPELTGVALTLVPYSLDYDLEVQRTDSDVSGSLIEGDWADLVTISSDQFMGGSATYVDRLPLTGLMYWYRFRHTRDGLDASDWSDPVSYVATILPANILSLTTTTLTMPPMSGTVATASYAYTASIAFTASLAVSASRSVTASYAVTASYVSGAVGGGAWSSITGKPTTIAGYGITDAYTKTESDTRYFNASNINAGTLADARLSSNVPLKNVANVFSNTITATAFYEPSSRKLKKDILTLTVDPLEVLRQTEIVQFRYVHHPELLRVGFIAEDTPRLLTGPDGLRADSVNALGVTMAAVKQLDALVASLLVENAELKKRVEALENR